MLISIKLLPTHIHRKSDCGEGRRKEKKRVLHLQKPSGALLGQNRLSRHHSPKLHKDVWGHVKKGTMK